MKAKWILTLMVATAAASGTAMAGGADYIGPQQSVFDRSVLDHDGNASPLAHFAASAPVAYAGPRQSVYDRAASGDRGDTGLLAHFAAGDPVDYAGPQRSIYQVDHADRRDVGEIATFEAGASGNE